MQDDLDKLIDGALAEYSSAEPLAGLEDRVMQRVRGAKVARRRSWLWALAIPAMAAILVVILMPKAGPPASPAATVMQPQPPVVVAPLAPATVRAALTKKRTRLPRLPEPRRLPKRQYFPTPTPLTAEERELAALALSYPAALPAPVERIEIKPIQIAPLQLDGGQ